MKNWTVNLSDEEKQQLQMILVDKDREEALLFLKSLNQKLLTSDGKLYRGCNIENASYTPSTCAERTAIFKAVSEGNREFEAIAVVTSDGGAPCGVCRQVMREFAPNLTVIIGDLAGNYQVYRLRDLLPDSFGPENLGLRVLDDG